MFPTEPQWNDYTTPSFNIDYPCYIQAFKGRSKEAAGGLTSKDRCQLYSEDR